MPSINGSYDPPPRWKSRHLIWEIIIIYWALTGKIKRQFTAYEFTTWDLPNGFKLQYCDYDNRWKVARMDEINEPFETLYVHPVYGVHGPLYYILALFMRREAAKSRGIKNWMNLEKERRKLKKQFY